MLHNATRNVDERAAKLFHLEARRREPSESAGPGEIVAISGMNKARTGDTLCPKGKHFLLEDIAAAMGLKPHETVAGLIYLGTPAAALEDRPRPDPQALLTRWQAS